MNNDFKMTFFNLSYAEESQKDIKEIERLYKRIEALEDRVQKREEKRCEEYFKEKGLSFKQGALVFNLNTHNSYVFVYDANGNFEIKELKDC